MSLVHLECEALKILTALNGDRVAAAINAARALAHALADAAETSAGARRSQREPPAGAEKLAALKPLTDHRSPAKRPVLFVAASFRRGGPSGIEVWKQVWNTPP